jgi:hypothetical protein
VENEGLGAEEQAGRCWQQPLVVCGETVEGGKRVAPVPTALSELFIAIPTGSTSITRLSTEQLLNSGQH